jgi:cell division protein FtsQ
VRGAAAAIGRRRLPRPSLSLRLPGPRLRLWLAIVVVLCLALAAGYQFWLRDSSFVAVEDVKVSGLTTKDAERVRAALTNAGHTMTTLNVDRGLLEQSVAHYPVVRGLQISTDFPHGLRIRVIEHHPAALVELGGDQVPVAGDGTILRGMPVEGRLPMIETEVTARGERLSSSAALHAARVAGAAPAPLRSRIEAITARKEDGIVVELPEGPELIFGDGRRAEAKWIAATRVLADPEAEGATYIDVRLPGRPAAGGLSSATVTPLASAGTPIAPSTGAVATDPAAAAVGATPPASGTTVLPVTGATPQAGAPPATALTTPPTTSVPTTTAPPQTTAAPAQGVAGGAGAPTSP